MAIKPLIQGKYIVLQLGYSHDIYFEPPEEITISAKKTEITINGINKQLVGEVAAKIRSLESRALQRKRN